MCRCSAQTMVQFSSFSFSPRLGLQFSISISNVSRGATGMGVGDVLEGVLERHTGHSVRTVGTDIV